MLEYSQLLEIKRAIGKDPITTLDLKKKTGYSNIGTCVDKIENLKWVGIDQTYINGVKHWINRTPTCSKDDYDYHVETNHGLGITLKSGKQRAEKDNTYT